MVSGDRNSSSNEQRARDCARKAKQMSPSVQYAIVTVLRNISNGAFWGFTTMKDIEEHIEVLKQEQNIKARKLGNACLLEINPSFMIQSMQMIDPTSITNKDLDIIQTAMSDAEMAFEKFLINKGLKLGKMGEQFSGTIGIYCVNNTETINYRGTIFPAFRITMDTALRLLGAYGYEIQVGARYMPTQQASSAGQILWDSMKLAPTKTGVFIDVRCRLTPDEMKMKQKQFKQKYGL